MIIYNLYCTTLRKTRSKRDSFDQVERRLMRSIMLLGPRLAALHLEAVMTDIQQDAHRGHRDEQ